jgi:hypothetical protein
MAKETVVKCHVCAKELSRKDSDKWYKHEEITVCRHHEGVEAWHQEMQTKHKEKDPAKKD